MKLIKPWWYGNWFGMLNVFCIIGLVLYGVGYAVWIVFFQANPNPEKLMAAALLVQDLVLLAFALMAIAVIWAVVWLTHKLCGVIRRPPTLLASL